MYSFRLWARRVCSGGIILTDRTLGLSSTRIMFRRSSLQYLNSERHFSMTLASKKSSRTMKTSWMYWLGGGATKTTVTATRHQRWISSSYAAFSNGEFQHEDDQSLFVTPVQEVLHRAVQNDSNEELTTAMAQEEDSGNTPHGISMVPTFDPASFLDRIRETFVHTLMPYFESNQNIVALIGVSGGSDSVGLLHALVQLRIPHLQLIAVHFDHQQRGIESDGDRQFVVDLCHQLKIPLHIRTWNSTTSSFSQETARTWRRLQSYEILVRHLSETSERGFILTAHHRDDSMETLCLKILRGVHITNLVGMDYVTKFPDMPRALWGRPFLGVSKEDIQQFLIHQSLTWREDASNASDKYKRNRVRNELIPLLVDILGSEALLQKRLENLSQQSIELRMDLQERAKAYLQQFTNTDYFHLPINSHDNSTITMTLVHREALHMWSGLRGIPFSYDQLQRICNQLEHYSSNTQWELPIQDKWICMRKGTVLSLEAHNQICNQISDEKILTWHVSQKSDVVNDSSLVFFLESLPHESSIILGTVGSLEQRNHDNGVKQTLFWPSWKQRPIRIQDFLRGQRVPLHLRDQVPAIILRQPMEDVVLALYIRDTWHINSSFRPTGTSEDRTTLSNGVQITVPMDNL